MVPVDTVIEEVFNYKTTRPFCYLKTHYRKDGTIRFGCKTSFGFQYNVFKNTKSELIFFIRYKGQYTKNIGKPSKREFLGFEIYIDNFVYGVFYSAVAAYLFSLTDKLPVFIGWKFHTVEENSNLPKRFKESVRYISKDMLLVGRLIVEEWMKVKRKENPSFTLEM